MTTNTDIVNRALQVFGSRTTVTDAELANNSTNEAIQANLILTRLRDELLRMAPWDCGIRYANLNLIYAVPGSPENPSAGTQLWTQGQPPPPWAYEYQYPNDCLRACWIIPAFQTGFAGGTPITTAVTGGGSSFWQGPPVKFKVATDKFYACSAAAVANGGTGFSVGDEIVLPSSALGPTPIGAGARLLVTAAPAGVISTVSVVDQVQGSNAVVGGSYFAKQTNPVAMASVNGVSGVASSGVGATFNLTFGTALTSQRVILTNQEYATLAYIQQVDDPDVFDPLFQDAWVNILGANLCLALTGDKTLANMCVQKSNSSIVEARKADGNEGLTINDVTPDFIRIRGIGYSDYSYSPNVTFNWGSMWTPF